MGYETVIGLEVHCQLKTRTKLFCGCRNEFGAPPNSLTCPTCTGQPGALPALNAGALDLALRAGVALGCTLAPRSVFARKNYFYCDLPKGYQISQYDRPFATGGGIELASGRRVRLVRIHLEEDAGKAIHDRGDATLVDLNRAGVPLIESVTEPDLRSSDEAHEYLTRLREILLFAGVSDCDMEKGSLRCDVNVSVHKPGTPLGSKVELKNLNSFRNVKDAIEVEVSRQVALLEGGGRVVQETRLFDAERGVTRSMRTKEDADDYRYFPDPDLPVLVITEADVEKARAGIPELPAEKRARYKRDYDLSPSASSVLTSDPKIASFFETTVAVSGIPQASANWVINEVTPSISPGLAPRLGELVKFLEAGTLSSTAAKTVWRKIQETGKSPQVIVLDLGLAQVNDEAQLEAWVREAIKGREAVMADIRAGKTKALGAILGPVMKASGGRANPEAVRAIVLRLAEEDGA